MKALTLLTLLLTAVITFAQQQHQNFTINFDVDESELSAAAQLELQRIATLALAEDIYDLRLHGHTDIRGDVAYNTRLAAKRVEAVRAALLQHQLEEQYIAASSFGESRPIDTEKDDNAHAQNRRVEISLTTKNIDTEEQLFAHLGSIYTSQRHMAHTSGAELRGEEGVVVRVPPLAFTHADGSELPTDAQVEVVIEEAIRPAAMLAHRLNTNGQSGRLSTGGMVRVTGRYQGEDLLLRPGAAIDVELPTADVDDEMRLYLGERLADGEMDWQLGEGETVESSTRIYSIGAEVKTSTGRRDSLAMIRSLLASRDSILKAIRIPEALVAAPPAFPKFKHYLQAFDPNFGEPQRPFIPMPPQREEITRGTLFNSVAAQQRKADAQYVSDSTVYVQMLPEYEAKLERWKEALQTFREEEPTRYAEYLDQMAAIRSERIAEGQAYLRDNHRMRAASKFSNWREDLLKRGPHAETSTRTLRVRAFEYQVSAADPAIVMRRAYGEYAAGTDLTADTTGLSLAAHQTELYDELAIADQVLAVERYQSMLREIFMTVEQRKAAQARRKTNELNSALTQKYSFQIRTPQPQWHNCDHPVPEGDYQLLVDRPSPVSVYFSSLAQGTVDYYPPGSMAAAVYTSPSPVEVVAFGFTDEGLKLCQTTATASRSQKGMRLQFSDAGVRDVERAIAELGAGPG